jgi:hypothetical protein
MRTVDYTDAYGRLKKVLLPNDAPDDHARYGILIGPPDFDDLGLGPERTTILNNKLFNLGLFEAKEVKRRREDVRAVLQSLFALDIEKIIQLYY